MEPVELAAWLRLLETPDVGLKSARKLLAAFGSPQAVIEAGNSARRDVAGPAAAAALGSSNDTLLALIATTLAWLAPGDNPSGPQSARHVITLGDPRYPSLLLEIADPPLLLYAQGQIELLANESIAIVGSRNPTPQGLENARAFATQLSAAGFTIVSGLALGIDAAAHEGALDAVASTVAVVGTGLDRVYPRQHKALAHRISEHGLLVSEYALGTPPLPARFPVRNRIIAGLSRGTLVVEAALQSGSLITARLAAEDGREVFAIPGSIHSPLSRGCHALIRQGAKLVEVAADVLEELSPRPSAMRSATPTTEEPAARRDPLLEAIGFDPVTLDALVERTGWPAGELNVRLLDLELEGSVARLPGQLFQRIARA